MYFLMGWLLVLGLKDCLVKCATVCVRSMVILINFFNKACQYQMVTPLNKEGSVILHAVFYYVFSEFFCPPLPHHYDRYYRI